MQIETAIFKAVPSANNGLLSIVPAITFSIMLKDSSADIFEIPLEGIVKIEFIAPDQIACSQFIPLKELSLTTCVTTSPEAPIKKVDTTSKAPDF